jgi:hypothetical protein
MCEYSQQRERGNRDRIYVRMYVCMYVYQCNSQEGGDGFKGSCGDPGHDLITTTIQTVQRMHAVLLTLLFICVCFSDEKRRETTITQVKNYNHTHVHDLQKKIEVYVFSYLSLSLSAMHV